MRTLMIPYSVVDSGTIYLPHDTDSFCWKCWVFDAYSSRFIARFLSIRFPKHPSKQSLEASDSATPRERPDSTLSRFTRWCTHIMRESDLTKPCTLCLFLILRPICKVFILYSCCHQVSLQFSVLFINFHRAIN